MRPGPGRRRWQGAGARRGRRRDVAWARDLQYVTVVRMPDDVGIPLPGQWSWWCAHATKRVDSVAAAYPILPAFENRPRLLGIVDDECEGRPVAPPAEEQVALDVDAGVREL